MGVGGGAARWDGTKWAAVAMRTVAAGQSFESVFCFSSTSCFALGVYSTKSGYANPVAERWNGKAWVVVPSKGTGYGYFDTYALSCAGPKVCTGVGSWTDALYSNEAYAERWNGMSWSAGAAASPSNAIVSGLYGIACPAQNTCFASGTYNSGPGPSGYPHPFVDAWDGTAWSLASTPDIYGGMGDVACASPTTCLAVGDSQQLVGPPDNQYFGPSKTLALRWDGNTWTRIASPNRS
jgi:hypothetical protein